MYDFILFEISKYPNHYKDLVITARMLKALGFSVVIFDYYKEKEECYNSGVPIIQTKSRHPKPSFLSRSKIRWINTIGHLIDRYKVSRYQYQILKELKGKYRNMYLGTYCDEISRLFIKNIDINANYFTWVVRSALLTTNVNRSLNWGKLNYFLIRKLVHNSKMKFFVSNEIIKKEIKSLGISEERLVLRPERYIEDLLDTSITHEHFTLLTLGSLRRSKRIELTLNALHQLDDKNIHVTIAGKVQGDESYEEVISKFGNNIKNFKRINHRLSEEEYSYLLNSSDFMVLCDEMTDSTITNGTMSEALMHYLPVIVPNYEPYKSLVEKYEIGILFDPNDIQSLSNAIIKAKVLSKQSFKPKIEAFLKTMTFDSVISLLDKEFKNINICPK